MRSTHSAALRSRRSKTLQTMSASPAHTNAACTLAFVPDLVNGLGNQLNAVAAALVLSARAAHRDLGGCDARTAVVLDTARVRNKHSADSVAVTRFFAGLARADGETASWPRAATDATLTIAGQAVQRIALWRPTSARALATRALALQPRSHRASPRTPVSIIVHADSAHLFLHGCPEFAPALRAALTPPPLSALSEPVSALTGGLDSLDTAFFLHVRRGDFISNPVWRVLVAIDLCAHYFPRALARFDAAATALVCTDDVDWAAEHLPRLDPTRRWAFVSPRASAADTLVLMAHCGRGGIAANSSFSFWGLLLNRHVREAVSVGVGDGGGSGGRAVDVGVARAGALWIVPKQMTKHDGLLRAFIQRAPCPAWIEEIDAAPSSRSSPPSPRAGLAQHPGGVSATTVLLAISALLAALWVLRMEHRARSRQRQHQLV